MLGVIACWLWILYPTHLARRRLSPNGSCWTRVNPQLNYAPGFPRHEIPGRGNDRGSCSGSAELAQAVLLNQLGREASELKPVFIRVAASCCEPLAVVLAKELPLAPRHNLSISDRARVLWSRAARVLRLFQVRVDPSGSYSFTIDLSALLESVGLVARGANMVLLLAVDELQEASRGDLAALTVALRNLGQDAFRVPVVFGGAGCPPARLDSSMRPARSGLCGRATSSPVTMPKSASTRRGPRSGRGSTDPDRNELPPTHAAGVHICDGDRQRDSFVVGRIGDPVAEEAHHGCLGQSPRPDSQRS